MNRNNNIREIKVGITVLAGIVLFVLVAMWAKNYSFDSETEIVKVAFPNVSGLYVKDKVTVNGVEKGYVSNLKISGNYVIAELTISRDVDLRSDAKFGIEMLDLMGGKKVEIKPGIAPEKLDIGKIQKGEFKGDISGVMASFGEMQTDLTAIIKQTKNITEAMNEILGKGKFGEELSRTMTRINVTLSKTNSLIENNASNLQKVFRNTAELSDSLNDFWHKNAYQLKALIHGSTNTLSKIDSSLSALNKILYATETSSNNLGKILNDEKYLRNLETTLTNLNELMKLLTEQLKGDGINVNTNIF